MKKLFAVRCLLFAVSCSLFALYAHASALIPLSTTTEFTSTAIARFRAYHGETVRLTHRLTLAGAPLDLSGASARFYWRTEEMEDWWSTDATLEGNAVSCDFTPEMDPGTEAIWYFFGITQANAIAYRANGSLTLLDSPGFTPADLGEPDALAAALEALFKEADTRYATKAEHAALATQVAGKADASHTHADLQQSATVLLQAINSEANLRETADNALLAQLTGKADAFTVGEGLTLEAGVLSANAPKITVDATLSATSVNPVQNKVVYSALNNKADKTALNGKASKYEFNSDNYTIPYVNASGASMHSLRTVFNANNEADNWAEKFDNAKLTFEWWHQYDNVKEDSFDVPMTAFRALANGGGGHTEVWKGNVGFGEQDTFFGPRRVAEGEGQFYKGYPRLHNHGQDIHEVSGFSRDSRDDETVWSHRLLLPWDLAKANDTSYLMAGVVWNGNRNIIFNGDTTTFVQPLVPTNKGDNAAYVPYALPCFENSPMFWKGQMIWHDGTTTLSKSVSIPWSRVTGTTASPSELALKSDLETLKSEPVAPTLEVATWSGTVCSVPWGANPLLIDCSGQTEYDFTIQFSVADWPEGAARLLFIRATPTPTVGDGIIDSLKGGNGLLTPSVVGYDYLEQGEEHTVSAWRRGSRLRLMVVDRERLSDL
ncbi:MAG: hypothetical protein IJV69_02300 [Kiritimatiellae bacterium]|nr:hypothetical protein [Kiritimatiellia bacterium]